MIVPGIMESSPIFAQVEAVAPLEWRVRWNWNWPLWATVLAFVTVTLWVAAIYLRETSTAGKGIRSLLSLLRLAAIALALLMFAQPSVEWFRFEKPRLVVLVDRSASMETYDRLPGTKAEISRMATWKNFLIDGEQPLIDQWLSAYQLDVIAFDEQTELLVDSEMSIVEQLRANYSTQAFASAGGTRLGDAVDYALRELPGVPPVAIVMVTDGIVTNGQTLQQVAKRARRLQIPLYPVAVGSDCKRPDVSVENMLVEEVVFPGDRLQVEATLRVTGYEGKSVEVVLRDATSKDIAARSLARTTLKLPADNTLQTVHLTFRPSKPGKLTLEVQIKPLDEETNIENNVVRQTIEVSDDKIKVLLVQLEPSYEYRALKSLLERDPAVELKVMLQEADTDYPSVEETALRAFPANEQELFAYDVLLLGDLDPGLMPRSIWPLIERFVTEHGGGLVGMAGPRFMPFAFCGIRSMQVLLPMPIDLRNPLRSQVIGSENYAITPTALGWRTPSLQLGETLADSRQIWQALPPLAWMLRLEDIKPGAQVLAVHQELSSEQNNSLKGKSLPVILRHYVGAGEVLFHATDETWRWRWRTDDRYFARYWGQVVRRLGRGRLAAGRNGVQLTADRSLYEPGERVQLQARFRNPSQVPADEDQVIMQLQRALGQPRQITLQRRLGRRGLFVASIEDLAPGEYRALLIQPDVGEGAEEANFEIRQPPRELANVVVNRRGLSEAAEISGGKYFAITNASELTRELPSPLQIALAEHPARQLWNSHVVVALFVILLTSEWLLRRRYGML